MAERELTSILAQPERTSEMESPGTLSEKLGLSPELAHKITEISSRPKANILSDQPAINDALGFEALVRTLSDVILSESTQTPITIGIDGEWGTGKTSILKMIEAQARMLEFPCIWLNAWSLESTENLIAAVASEIQRESRSSKRPRKELIAEYLIDWMSQAAVTLSSSAIDLFPGLAGRAFREALDQLKRTVGVVKASREREQEISEIASIVTTRQSFERLVQLLLQDSDSEHSRLIVFIDDIDRALPDQIATILKNLKLILEIPQCVFVLAMDIDIVARSIENYYRRQSQNLSLISLGEIRAEHVTIAQAGQQEAIETGFGYNYLEKLIQIRVGVPPLTRETVYAYLHELRIAPEVLEIIHWAPDEEVLNPRRLKRYINWLSISLQLIESVPMPHEVRNVTALRAMALQRDYPKIYAHLLGSESIVEVVSQIDLQHLLPKRKSLKSLELETADFRRYLGKNLPPSELFKFDEFVRRTPMLDMGRKGYQSSLDVNQGK